jgi:antirestriction protein
MTTNHTAAQNEIAAPGLIAAAAASTAAARIYVACLASYNNGSLYGRWIDCDGKDADDLQAEVATILRGSKYPNTMVDFEGQQVPSAEEWAIHDYDLGGIQIGEWESFENVAAIAEALNGDYAPGFAYLFEDLDMSATDALAKADEVCLFEGTAKEYAESLLEDYYGAEIEALPDLIKYNIDTGAIANDLQQGGDIVRFEHDGTSYLITNSNAF